MSGLTKKSATSAAWLFVRFGGRQGANAIAFFGLAALMSPAEFGLASIPVAFVVIFKTLLNRGFRDIVIQREELTDEALDTAWWLNFLLGCALATVVLAVAPLIALGYGDDRLVALTATAATVLVFTGASAIQEARIERAFRHRLLTFAQILASLAAAALAIWLAMRGYGAWAVVAFNVVEALCLMVVTWALARWSPGFRMSFREAGRQLAFGWQLAVSTTLATGSLRFIQLILGLMLGPQAVAHFRVASQINQLLTQTLAAPLVRVLLPAFSRSTGDRARQYLRAYALSGAISLPAFIGAAAVAPTLLVMVLGEAWRPAAEASGILCFAIVPALALQIMNPMLIATGRPNVAARMSLGSAMVGVASAAIGGIWGVGGAAIGFVARGLITIPLGMRTTRRLIGPPLSRQLRSLAAFLVPSIVMYIVVRAILTITPANPIEAWFLLGLSVAAGAALYAILVRFVVSRVDPEAYEPILAVSPARLRAYL